MNLLNGLTLHKDWFRKTHRQCPNLLSQMDLSDIKDSYVRKKEIPFSSEQKWMAVECRPKNEVSVSPPLSYPPPQSKMQPSGRSV